MSEKPRSFPPEKSAGGGGGTKSSHCGTCGLPGKECQCSSYKERGVSGATKPGTMVGEKLPAKFSGEGGS